MEIDVVFVVRCHGCNDHLWVWDALNSNGSNGDGHSVDQLKPLVHCERLFDYQLVRHRASAARLLFDGRLLLPVQLFQRNEPY